MAINTGVNESSLVGFVALDIPVGISETSLVAYLALDILPGINESELVAYIALDSGNVNPPAWSAFTFNNGGVGVTYDQTFDMPTSAEIVAYSLLSGALPDGLTLDPLTHNQAHLHGTPTVANTFAFTLRAVNTYGTVDQAFSILINPAWTGVTFPPAYDVYYGVDRGDGVTGTLRATTIATAAGSGVDLAATDLRSGVIVDDVTGAAAIPSPADVRFGTAVDATTGAAHIPAAADVRTGVAVDATVGTADIPAATDVRAGVAVDATVGNMTEPSVADVVAGVQYGAAGTEFTGTLAAPDYPADTNVRDGVAYDSGAATGNMTEPAVTDVKTGVRYGANGTEFTGTLASGGGGKHGHGFGF